MSWICVWCVWEYVGCECNVKELRIYAVREELQKEDCSGQLDEFRKQRCLGSYYSNTDLN